MRNSPNRIKFRQLAFKLQNANEYNKIDILYSMLNLMSDESDQLEIEEMHRTIIANIINHNIVIGINKNEYNRSGTTSTMATNC